jgi:hypothetical protein
MERLRSPGEKLETASKIAGNHGDAKDILKWAKEGQKDAKRERAPSPLWH